MNDDKYYKNRLYIIVMNDDKNVSRLETINA